MSFLRLFSIFLIGFLTSCEQQGEPISLSYTAQTRGFYFEVQLKDSLLEISKNQESEQVKLTDDQIIKLQKFIVAIDFEAIKNNLSVEDVAVDKAIPGAFKITYKKKEYEFQFDHHKLPKKIDELIHKLMNFTTLEQ